MPQRTPHPESENPSARRITHFWAMAAGGGVVLALGAFSIQGWMGAHRSIGGLAEGPLPGLILVAVLAAVAGGFVGARWFAAPRAGGARVATVGAPDPTLQAVVDQAPDGIVVVDHARTIRSVNRAFAAMTGINREDCIGKPLAELEQRLAHAGDPQQTESAHLSAALDGPVSESASNAKQRRIYLTVPSARVLEWTALPQLGGSPNGALLFRDITHHVEVEQMKAEFLSVAAHELRTPLSSILGFAEILGKGGLDDAELREFAGLIETESRRLADILDDLLDLTRIDASGLRAFSFRELTLAPLVEATINQAKPPSNKWRLALQIEPNGQWWIRADRNKLQQVIGNLLSNAVKYSPEGGEIKVTVAWREREGKRLAEIAVIDQGMGMSAAQVARAFDRFFRADTSGSVAGTGLGLSLVKEIVTRHGGEVLLDSQKGVGTRVRILLPASPRKTVPND